MSPVVVSALSVTPVKGTRLLRVPSVELGPLGAVGDRRFMVIDERQRMVNAKRLGALQTVLAEFDAGAGCLALSFPDGRTVEGAIASGPVRRIRFYSRMREVQAVEGPWSRALSDHLGEPVWLAQARSGNKGEEPGAGTAGSGVDRGAGGAVSLISRASLERLAREAGSEHVDARRFRMLIEVDGLEAHEEDSWVGRRVEVGDAVVRFEGNVGRCLITSRDPDSGEVDLPTLDLLRGYRDQVTTTEPIPFGVYGRVLRGGRISVGDQVSLV